MNENIRQSFFLGANSYGGFCSLYREYVLSGDMERLYILKGGAGCGKSTFLRAVADKLSAEGFAVRLIYCSGDPDSLDGIDVPALKTAVFDGTAPHVLEPEYAGERDFYIDLSRFYKKSTSGLKELADGCRAKYKRAYSYLAAAGSLSGALAIPEEAAAAIGRRAGGIIARELKKTGRRRGRTERLFADAFTFRGFVSHLDTLTGALTRIISLDNAAGAAKYLLAPIAEAAAARGYDLIVCPSPLAPEEPRHLILPELSLGFVSARGGRRLHLDKTALDAMGADERQSFRETLALREQALLKAQAELKAAKALHDELEARVNPNVDFGGIRDLAAEYAGLILSELKA